MGHGGNVIQELTADHREVDQMFTEIEAMGPGAPRRRELVDELTKELVRHAVAEEEYLYPAVRRFVDDGDDLADQEVADHAEVERLLKELEGCEAGDPRFDTLVTQLKSSVTSHVADEEKRLFPLLAESCSADFLMELGDKVRRAKETAPTRPHPSAPDTPPANKLLAPGMGMVDRVRDLLTSRGRG
ncbi:hemerythrin domain-containing protein [Streptomyces xantholiticus]|uniref:Hemerythrin domain-containing protein n=1 Tax=Streptomyces xantholiticus TaxID=68285 RepID=A0ABV1UX97_9ACTN|nr:hemerythrin domain-containing protein [Streptomyces xantholiticus]ATW51884.1 hemerythrin [Streptomyces peucetius subsp. caesius ATCC 27952]GGW22630.1 hemerythrin [Streptomyces xantholiticus]